MGKLSVFQRFIPKILMELCALGSCRDVMNLRQKNFSEQEIATILKDALRGLEYLHGTFRQQFSDEQIKLGLLTPYIGNTYSGAVPIGLASILDEAKPGDRILAISFGSGAGSDGFDITVTDEIKNFNRDAAPTMKKLIEFKKEISYSIYAKLRGKIFMGGEPA